MSRSIAVLVCPHLGQVFILKRGTRRQPRRQRSRPRATFQAQKQAHAAFSSGFYDLELELSHTAQTGNIQVKP
jgi:hypothetical protein